MRRASRSATTARYIAQSATQKPSLCCAEYCPWRDAFSESGTSVKIRWVSRKLYADPASTATIALPRRRSRNGADHATRGSWSTRKSGLRTNCRQAASRQRGALAAGVSSSSLHPN